MSEAKVEKAEKVEQPVCKYEKRFVKAYELGDTVWLVLDGKRRAFTSWQALAERFGMIPQYDAKSPGGVVILPPEEILAIPEGKPFA